MDIFRRREVIDNLYNSFSYIEGEWCISIKDIALIFRGGRYAINEIKLTVMNHDKIKKDKEKIIIINNKSKKNTNSISFSYFNFYINLNFLFAIIKDVTDDEEDIQSFNIYYFQNIDTFDTTTPHENDTSFIVSLGQESFRGTK